MYLAIWQLNTVYVFVMARQRLAQGRHDVAGFERAAHPFDQHAVEARLRTPSDAVGACNFGQLLDFDRNAAAGCGRTQDRAVVVGAVEDVRKAHDVAFDHDKVCAQRLRVRRNGKNAKSGSQYEGEAVHGSDPCDQRNWLTVLSIWSEAWMTFEFIS